MNQGQNILENKEILIIDDASTDKSVSVIQNTIHDIPYARLIVHEENRGTGAARNSIIDNAAGEFIAFFDDDDLYNQEPDWGPHVPDLGVFTQGWDDSKASALVAAHAADVALYEMMRFFWPEDPGPPFTEALNRVDKLVQFKRRLLPRLGWWCGDLFEKSLRTRNPSVDRICQAEEEEYLSLVERASRFPGDFYSPVPK